MPQEPISVELGQRYVLRLPADLPDDHQLRCLRDELSEWLRSRRPGSYDETGWVWQEDQDAEPVNFMGHAIVTPRELGTIFPDPDLNPMLDEEGEPYRDNNGDVMLCPPRWQPLPEPVPAVKIHLERRADQIPAWVDLTVEQIEGLRHLGLHLDPTRRWVLDGWLIEVDKRGQGQTPPDMVLEGAHFLVPAEWLHSLNEVSWGSEEWDLNRLAQEGDAGP
jgi:hypothetical protein